MSLLDPLLIVTLPFTKISPAPLLVRLLSVIVPPPLLPQLALFGFPLALSTFAPEPDHVIWVVDGLIAGDVLSDMETLVGVGLNRVPPEM